jgi:DNA polymerase
MKPGPEDFPQEIVPGLISYLESLRQKGINSVYLEPSSPAGKSEPDPSPPSSKETEVAVHKTSVTVAEQLAAIENTVRECTDCGLHKGRTNGVPGTGNPETKVMFIGEGPGRDEDKQGLPFVGRSGQLLTKILAAIDLERKDVYITNMVKCRPPDNRDPQEAEVRCCEKYLISQIDLIKPKIICALGRIAAHWLLDTKASLSFLRENDNSYHGTPVLVTYHPAALLRNPGLKKDAWEDFKRLKAIIEEA